MKRCKPRTPGCYEEANGSFMRQEEYCCVAVENETGQTSQ